MLLTVSERMALLSILPREKGIVTLRIIRQLREDLSFSEEEIHTLELREEGGRTLWRADKAEPKEVSVGEKATDVVVAALREADREERLVEAHIPLWDRFVEKLTAAPGPSTQPVGVDTPVMQPVEVDNPATKKVKEDA